MHQPEVLPSGIHYFTDGCHFHKVAWGGLGVLPQA